MVRIIEVTKEDIAYGDRRSACNCPIAKALSRNLPGKATSVTRDRIRVSHQYYRANEDIYNFVRSFDRGDDVNPFSFDFDSLEPIKDED